MSLTINANGLNRAENSVLPANGNEGKQQGRKTFFAGDSNIANDPIAMKRKEAQKKAMKVVQDAWANDRAVDDSIQARKKHFAEMEKQMDVSRKELASINDDEKALQEIYNVPKDSKEQQDLDLLKKRQDYANGVTTKPLTMDELEKLAEIDKNGLTEYQSRALELNGMAGKCKRDIADAMKQMADDVSDIKSIELERLKTHPMVDAKKTADSILKAANDEIIGMLVQEAKDTIDEKMEEAEEKAKEKAEEKEEKEEHLEDVREMRAIQEALIEGTKEAVERAEAERRRNETPDMELTEMIDITKQSGQTGDVQKSLDDIKNSMKLLEADLKGIKVDQEV